MNAKVSTAARCYFIAVWLVGVVSFTMAIYDDAAYAFVFEYLWVYFALIAAAILMAPLLFPKNLQSLWLAAMRSSESVEKERD